MNGSIKRGLALALALSVMTAPLAALNAEAGPRDRRNRDRGHRSEQNYRDGSRKHHSRSGHRYKKKAREHRRYDRRQANRHARPQYRHQARRHHRSHYRHDRRHHRGSGVVPFLGGVALGAIIGGSHHPVRRVYVYDCGYCDYTGRGYTLYLDHMVVSHRIAACDVAVYYPQYEGGYWEDY